MRRFALASLALALVAVAPACGGSDEESEEAAASPQEAVAEIDQVHALLDDALAKYKAGDADAAEQTVGDAYLEHFEKVEHPLEERDEELNEELEEKLSHEIREKMKDDAPVAEVEGLVTETKADLDRAKSALEGS